MSEERALKKFRVNCYLDKPLFGQARESQSGMASHIFVAKDLAQGWREKTQGAAEFPSSSKLRPLGLLKKGHWRVCLLWILAHRSQSLTM